MVKPNEVRIGNFVEYPPYQWFEISGTSIVELQLNKREYFGIPITEELIERMGFTKGRFSVDYQLKCDGFTFTYSWNKATFLSIRNWAGRVVLTPDRLMYVHELQNIFFSMTGKELQIKL